MAVEIPAKGQIVSLDEIEELCQARQWIRLWSKIVDDPPQKPFKSDGCSWWPDEWRSAITDLLVDIYPRCFKHDLAYWSGHSEEDNIEEQVHRFYADTELVTGVVIDTGRPKLGEIMFSGVRMGGAERWKRTFSWGFGRTL